MSEPYGPPNLPESWGDYDPETRTWLDRDTGLRVKQDGSVYPWQDTGFGYEVRVDAEGNEVLDPRTGKQVTRTVKTSAQPAARAGGQPTPAEYSYGSITPRGGGGGITPLQSATLARQERRDERQAQMDEIAIARQQVQDEWQRATDLRDFEAAQKWKLLDTDLRERQHGLQQEQLGLNRQGQAFEQESIQRRETMDLGERPESYLTSLGASGMLPSGQNALFDLLGSLGGGRKTPQIEAFQNAQAAQASGQSAAVPPPAVVAAPTASTGMYDAGYEAQNPNVAEQLKQWQAERIQQGQDPNDTEAFRQHELDLGAPDFGVAKKPNEAFAPTAVKPLAGVQTAPGEPLPIGGVGAVRTQPLAGAVPAGAPGSGTSPKEMRAKQAFGAAQAGALPPFPTRDEILGLSIGGGKTMRDTSLGTAMLPLGSPGRPSTGISPFAVKPLGGMLRASAQTMQSLNPEDALALGQTYRDTGNRALLQDQLRKPYARALVR